MKRLFILLALVAILLVACGCKPVAPEGGNLAIYLPAEKLSPDEVAKADLRALKLEDEPVLSTEDIVAYSKETHKITLTAPAAERIANLKVPASGAGIPFVVCVGREPIYSGAFWSIASSLSFHGVMIMVPLDPQRRSLRIDYRGEPDPRADPRILQALERAGKLK